MTARLIACHSILQLDARHPLAARCLLDAQDMHRLVMSGFRGWVEDGQPDARAQMGVLSTWSVDLRNNVLVLVVQSKVNPDWSHLPGEVLTAKVETLGVDQPLRRGDRFSVRAVLAPLTARRDPKHPERGTRKLPEVRPGHVREWLMKRTQPATEDGIPAEDNGTRHVGAVFDPTTLAIRALPAVTSNHHAGLRISRSEIRGHLTVTDPEAFRATLADGLGSGRAYSCGLVLVRRP
ncbi:type I-E CRISPR-associated protein Cas6/Cse3/CasE [Kitasatospora sp. NPDC004723]|uniref:type I-E CRISPR-associated protein Cas6/Cse3/CasE n=1 Tax=Kitasatospora sp. NPDC004723 TaxID=3154288 RepID=UPI0033B22C8E